MLLRSPLFLYIWCKRKKSATERSPITEASFFGNARNTQDLMLCFSNAINCVFFKETPIFYIHNMEKIFIWLICISDKVERSRNIDREVTQRHNVLLLLLLSVSCHMSFFILILLTF